jgi:ADP-ribosyl-[dinitrogen reductase] hydrolase
MNKDQALGAMVGLAIGDALGTTLEFSRNPTSDRNLWHTEITGGGPFNLTAGGWTDDTSMALALMQSYLDAKQFDPTLCARYFVDWYRNGAFSHTGDCFDIGFTTLEALSRCERFPRAPYQGSTDPQSSGNGGIMRLAPSVIANTRNIEQAVEDAVNQSRITHASEESLLYADLLARVLFCGDPFIDEVAPYVIPDNTPWEALLSGGYVKETFQCAMWAARNTESFEECLIYTVNRRFDADTTGAVAGQIAGAIHGLSGIPERWLDTLIDFDSIVSSTEKLYELGLTP